MGRIRMRRSSERAWSLSTHLLALCLAILVPGIALGSVALWSLFSAERISTELRLLQAVDAIANSIEREILGATRVGESLAASTLLHSRDFAAFDLQARQLLGLQGWFVILTDPGGSQIVNTTLPAGTPLAQTDMDRIRDVVEVGKPRISDLFYAAGKRPLVGVRIPVVSGGETAYVLTVAVPAEIFTPLLDQSIGKLSWIVEVADRSGRIIARSRDHAEHVGKALSASAVQQRDWGMPIRRGVDVEGDEGVRVMGRSSLVGWIVAATVPSNELAAISRQGWTTFALLAVALAALAIFLAYFFARRIAQPIHQLASVPLEGWTDRFPETGLAEADRVGAALIESIRELEASEERYRTLVEAANDIIYTTDLDGRFLTCNAAGYKALGFTDGELIGRPLSSLISSGQPCTIEDLLTSAGRQGQKRFEVEVTAQSGRPLIWEISSRLLRDTRGIPETVLSIARDVTDRKRAEEAIRANEERLRLALAGVGAGVWEYDFATRERTWSPEMMELYGLAERAEPPTRDEMMLNLVHPGDRERLHASFEEPIGRGGPFAAQFRIVRPDGRLVWISSKGVVELDADGRAVRARGIDQDVTAARKAEIQREQLLHTTAQQLNELQSLYNSAPIGLALLDRELRFQRINSVLAEMIGVPVEDCMGRLAWDLVPAFRPVIEPLFQHVLDSGEPMTGIELSGGMPAQPDVERAWVVQLYPLKSPEEAVVGIGLICEEVTEQRRAQLGQAHLAAIVEASTDAIISRSTDGHIRSWNPGAEHMFGYTAVEAIGRGVDLLVPPGSGDAHNGFYERVKAGERLTVEALRLRKDGTEIPVSISASPMHDRSGRIVAVSVIFRDISEQKRREEHTRFIMRELSHRSKNLLAVIQAMARQTARTSRDLTDFQDRFTSRVRGLSQSHDLLVKRDWRGVPVSELVRAHLVPFVDRAEQGLMLSGPSLSLKPGAAQNIGLALHELATNASKHGALASPTGRIEVHWDIDERDGDRRFRMLWRETGGPKVDVPSQRGFGHTVVEAMIGRALEGEAHIDWQRDGIVWKLDVPAGCVSSEESPLTMKDPLPEGISNGLQALYRHWLVLSSRSGGLPHPSTIDLGTLPGAEHMFLVAIDPAAQSARSRYLFVGEALARLGRPDRGEAVKPGAEIVLGPLDGDDEWAMVGRRPRYGWARLNLGDELLEFERLLLPFAEDGKTVSHILGLAAVNKNS